jgi:hypothetical protein
MPSSSSPASFSLSFTSITYKFTRDDEAIDVCGIKDITKSSNSPQA